MTEQLILRELQHIPEEMKVQVLHFVQFLKHKHSLSQTERKPRKAGSAEGKYSLAPDFDEPLKDF